MTAAETNPIRTLAPERPPNGFLVDAQRRPDRPQAHPEPPHSLCFDSNPLELKGVMRKHHEFHVNLRNGSNWLQSRPLIAVARRSNRDFWFP
jgi:hypothetical protein